MRKVHWNRSNKESSNLLLPSFSSFLSDILFSFLRIIMATCQLAQKMISSIQQNSRFFSSPDLIPHFISALARPSIHSLPLLGAPLRQAKKSDCQKRDRPQFLKPPCPPPSLASAGLPRLHLRSGRPRSLQRGPSLVRRKMGPRRRTRLSSKRGAWMTQQFCLMEGLQKAPPVLCLSQRLGVFPIWRHRGMYSFLAWML